MQFSPDVFNGYDLLTITRNSEKQQLIILKLILDETDGHFSVRFRLIEILNNKIFYIFDIDDEQIELKFRHFYLNAVEIKSNIEHADIFIAPLIELIWVLSTQTSKSMCSTNRIKQEIKLYN